LIAANRLENPNLLAEGQQLKIPPATGDNVLPGLPTRDYGYTIVGFSGQGRAIEAFSFGEGPRQIILVGGMHGGYEWNTVLLAYEIVDYFYGNQDLIPEMVTLHIIPVANPDGLYLVTGRVGRFTANQVGEPPRASRFNGRGVDLNRNWSCGWSASARWGGSRVDPGSEPFSEPETRALRAYFLEQQPVAVIFWHSQANLVAPGRCGGDAGSSQLAEIYGEAAGYPATAFTAYELSGTASDWLNEQGIPAATVELADHQRTASGQNLAGIFAMLEYYGASAPAAE
jgi:predicted deacylase